MYVEMGISGVLNRTFDPDFWSKVLAEPPQINPAWLICRSAVFFGCTAHSKTIPLVLKIVGFPL